MFDNLQEVPEVHRTWLGMRYGKRADLHGANLSGADLSGADLSGADLSGADLHGADLSGADLSDADLSGADLSGADLSGADLSDADLHGANLSDADLHGANLSGANLHGADLSGSKLSDAIINWMSHDLIAELLRKAAGDKPELREVAGVVLISRDWCWDDFERIYRDDSRMDWAIDTLAACVRDGDGAPQILRARAEKLREGHPVTPESGG